MIRHCVLGLRGACSCSFLLFLLYLAPQATAQPDYVRGDFGGDHIVDLPDVLSGVALSWLPGLLLALLLLFAVAPLAAQVLTKEQAEGQMVKSVKVVAVRGTVNASLILSYLKTHTPRTPRTPAGPSSHLLPRARYRTRRRHPDLPILQRAHRDPSFVQKDPPCCCCGSTGHPAVTIHRASDSLFLGRDTPDTGRPPADRSGDSRRCLASSQVGVLV